MLMFEQGASPVEMGPLGVITLPEAVTPGMRGTFYSISMNIHTRARATYKPTGTDRDF